MGGYFRSKQFHCKLFGFKTEILGIKDFLWHYNVESSLLVFLNLFIIQPQCSTCGSHSPVVGSEPGDVVAIVNLA